jgi:hypothetical protein
MGHFSAQNESFSLKKPPENTFIFYRKLWHDAAGYGV